MREGSESRRLAITLKIPFPWNQTMSYLGRYGSKSSEFTTRRSGESGPLKVTTTDRQRSNSDAFPFIFPPEFIFSVMKLRSMTFWRTEAI